MSKLIPVDLTLADFLTPLPDVRKDRKGRVSFRVGRRWYFLIGTGCHSITGVSHKDRGEHLVKHVFENITIRVDARALPKGWVKRLKPPILHIFQKRFR